jgi:DNA gyrase subunit A
LLKGLSLSTDSNDPDSSSPDNNPAPENQTPANLPAGAMPMGMGKILDMGIEDELKGSYLTYAMSVIVSRALPDVRDGLKPSQRRILVAMNDLNLSPGAARVKCAKISGDTSGNYHPHGESVIYPTLVRMAQEWNLRHTLIDKQGNFGSIAGLPAAAMRYTEARMSAIAAAMLDDLKLDTVDFIPTYDERRLEPVVLPSRFPNLIVNGANGIAVGMATSIPPHNLGEICDALVRIIDDPDVSIDELLELTPGPDFPTGGVICGRSGIRRGYYTGRSTIVVRARAAIEEHGNRYRIIVSEIPFQQTRDRIEEKIHEVVNEGKIPGISGCRNESDLEEPVRLVLDLKRDADPEVVLAQLYQFTPLQDTISLIFLALVDGKPRVLNFKELLYEFLRHRETVIRRRTQFLLLRARQRKHTVEGLLLAHANIDEVIRVIRSSSNQAEAKERLMQIQTPSPLLERALGEEGFAMLVAERGKSEFYTLTPVQADAILRMTLGQLVNLEQEKLGDEHRKLLAEITEYNRILSDRQNILDLIREELKEMKRKHSDARRTEISGEELGDVNLEDLIEEEMMVVSITSNGYIKRTPVSAYRAQRRGGKGLTGAKTEDEDPVEHLFVANTHDYLLFFTNKGKVYWRKVYDLPQLARDSRGRAVVNLLNLAEDEKIADCRAIKNFDEPDHYLVMATAKGLLKKTPLAAYGRPMKTGIIAIKLREGDELVDVDVAGPGDELLMATAKGMAIRFRHTDARAVGRNSSGVKGIKLSAGDSVIGMVVADPEATLLTACANGYGKRTPFGPNLPPVECEPSGADADDEHEDETPEVETDLASDDAEENEDGEGSSGQRYRTQNRGGKGLRDIKTTDRNGPAIGIASVRDDDEIFMMTSRGKLQRIAVSDISIIGRNTQGVKIMGMDEEDTLIAVKRVPKEEGEEKENGEKDE